MGKLFVIHAEKVNQAIIIRRGPAKWRHLISWNTKTDEFEHGAWIKGRIYEEKCDLSPDGKLFLYFVLKEPSELRLPNTWTALSRPPWLKALALWPHGDTYYGGGRFTGNRKIEIRSIGGGWGDSTHPDFPCTCVKVRMNQNAPHHKSEYLVPGADWSGRDLSGQIIYTKADQVFRINQKGVEKLVADFSDLKPDPQPEPDWASEAP